MSVRSLALLSPRVRDPARPDFWSRREGQDLSIAAQGRSFARLLERWRLDALSVVATNIGGAIGLRALLLEHAAFADLCCSMR
jgi:hypothetical protein